MSSNESKPIISDTVNRHKGVFNCGGVFFPLYLELDNVDSIGFNENFTKSSRPLLQLH